MIHVLLIEDEKTMRERIKGQLLTMTEHEFKVSEAGSLSEAVKVLEYGGTDIVILDPGLPNGQGAESVKQVIRHALGAPVMTLTKDSSDFAELRAAGADDCVTKDAMGAKEMAAHLEDLVARHQSRRQVRPARAAGQEVQAMLGQLKEQLKGGSHG